MQKSYYVVHIQILCPNNILEQLDFPIQDPIQDYTSHFTVRTLKLPIIGNTSFAFLCLSAQ